MDEREVTVTLTVDQVRALRMALIFGAPDKPHDVLESARAKLHEAEAGAQSNQPERSTGEHGKAR